MEKILFLVLLSILAAGIFTIGPAQADLISPAITHVYFEKDGTPYNGSVQYSVNCYGYTYSYPPVLKTPGSYQPELVYHYSASCGEYGCSIHEPYYFRYTHIDRCDLEGTTDSGHFSIRNFSALPYTRCDFVQYRAMREWGGSREYYYETPEYFACRQFFRTDEGTGAGTIWADQGNYSGMVPINSTSVLALPGRALLYGVPPWSHVVISKTDIPLNRDQYIRYLETCDPVTDRNCSGWLVEGKPLKSFIEYRTLKDNATHLEDDPCDTFLVRADPSLIMPFTDDDPWHHACADDCNYTMQICELQSTIPDMTPALSESPKTPDELSILLNASATLSHPVFRSPVESLYCGIVEISGGRCE